MTALNTELTANELRAALILVSECFAGMGGSRPSDLEHDEYTWVDAKTLMAHGYSAAEANGTIGALQAKGFVFEYDKNELVLDTPAWRYLDTIWDAQKDLINNPTTKEEKKETKMTKTQNSTFNVRVFNDNLNVTFPIVAATAGAAIKLMRQALKIGGVSRKLGTVHFRATKG